ncbi:MAG: ABC transporter substrate-binding protein [Candidatus Lustribacter sp.]
MARTSRLAVVLGLALLIGALPQPGLPAATGAPLEVYALLSMTGNAAFLGAGEQDALHKVEALTNASGGINGRPLKFIVEDNQSSPQVDVQLMSAALATHPVVVIDGGPLAGCRANVPLLTNGPVVYCLSNSLPTVPGSWVFSTAYATRDALAVAMSRFRQMKIERIAVLSPTDATGQETDQLLRDAAQAPENVNDVSFVAFEHFNPTDISVSAQLAHIKETNPQLLISYTTGTALGTVFRGMQTLGLDDLPVFPSSGSMSWGQLTAEKDIILKDVVFAGPPLSSAGVKDPDVKKAVETFLRAFPPSSTAHADFISALAWDPAMIVVYMLRKIGPNGTAAQLHDGLMSLRGYPGVFGRYDFPASPQRGLTGQGVLLQRWDKDLQTWVPLAK